jgi:hypothetical protein
MVPTLANSYLSVACTQLWKGFGENDLERIKYILEVRKPKRSIIRVLNSRGMRLKIPQDACFAMEK